MAGIPPTSPDRPMPGARAALLLLLAINLFNYVDRYVLAAVVPDISRDLFLTANPDDPNVKAKMGFLATAFLLTYMIAAPIVGWLAERTNRWMLVGVGVILWSLASGGSGLAATFTALVLTRCLIGVGEGAYGPIAPTMIADYYPVARRGRTLAWFYMAIPVGSALGYALGGQVAASSLGWRWGFYLVVIPGLLLGVWCFFMRQPGRGAADAVSIVRKSTARDWLVLLHTPSYVLNTLGMAAMTFAIGGISYWMPDYLGMRKVQGLWGLDARTIFGGFTAGCGLVATLIGGFVGDWLRPRFSGAYFLVSAWGMLLGVPCIIAFMFVPFPLAWVFIGLAEFCLFFNTGPSNTILANVTHPAIRATAFAINILVIHSLGDAVSPPLIGAIADRSNLTVAFLFVSGMMVVGGILWWCGAKYLAADTAAAPHRLAD